MSARLKDCPRCGRDELPELCLCDLRSNSHTLGEIIRQQNEQIAALRSADAAALHAVREHARALGYGELLHLRTGEAGGRVWVAFHRAEPAFGASLVEACAAWCAAHPAPATHSPVTSDAASGGTLRIAEHLTQDAAARLGSEG